MFLQISFYRDQMCLNCHFDNRNPLYQDDWVHKHKILWNIVIIMCIKFRFILRICKIIIYILTYLYISVSALANGLVGLLEPVFSDAWIYLTPFCYLIL